ncbi:MAG: NTP transferase domain-containing protein [Polyangiaceae bacterium]|nr:NTP transferase domain-containing protein [Polyangiaceae bacterium]MCL4752705.1 NTP transferase domain-containing protein [Myxococcales bacterium]
MPAPLVGIFVGGRGSRMGGVAKGLLVAPGAAETLVARLERVAREALGDPEVVLVGRAEAYASLGLPFLEDQPPGVGPIGGLGALLGAAAERGSPFALALACDLPFVSAALLRRLSAFEPRASAVAPRQGELWQPLCARYAPTPAREATRALIATGARSLQAVLTALDAVELPLETSDELRDWDEPGDLS